MTEALEKERFKAEFDSRLDKSLFKIALADGYSVHIETTLKLIVPVKPMMSLTDLFTHVYAELPGDKRQLDDIRGSRKNRIVYNGDPVLDIVGPTCFYLHSGWSIYSKYRNNIKCAGWSEINGDLTLSKVYSVFRPMGKHKDGAIFRITRSGGITDEIPCPPSSDDASLTIDTTDARKLEFVYSDGNKEYPYDLLAYLGVAAASFTRTGHLVEFPTAFPKTYLGYAG